MRVTFKVGRRVEDVGWNTVKLFGVIVVLGALISSSTRGVVKPAAGGIKTVVPAVIRAGQIDLVTVPFSARVRQVMVSAGATVTEGQVVAVLESDEVTRRVESAQRRLAAAQRRASPATGRRMTLVESLQLRTAQRGLDLARKRLADSSIAEAEAAYKAAKGKREQISALVGHRLATVAELEAAAREEQNESRNLSAAREHVSRLEQELDSYETQVAVLKAQMSAGAQNQDDSNSDLELADAKVELESAIENRDKLEVKAPRNGIVLSNVPAAGDPVFAGAPVMYIADVTRLSFEAAVSALIARQIRPGTAVRLRVPTEPPRQVDAEISTVALLPDPVQQSYVVKAVIANPDRSVILVGMEGAMEFPHSESAWRRLF